MHGVGPAKQRDHHAGPGDGCDQRSELGPHPGPTRRAEGNERDVLVFVGAEAGQYRPGGQHCSDDDVVELGEPLIELAGERRVGAVPPVVVARVQRVADHQEGAWTPTVGLTRPPVHGPR